MRFVILTSVCLGLNAGCMVRGFQNLPSDSLTTPGQLRSAAAIARSEATALEEIADQQEGVIRNIIGAAQAVTEQIGAPALVTGLVGGLAGFAVPTPGQKRRERVAAAEAKAGTPPPRV